MKPQPSPNRQALLWGFALLGLALGACTPTVKVQPPDKPIEINLNVRIEHEVRIKIDRELDAVFADKPELFGIPKEHKP
ncbi:MAG TPA: YnbE family lipoprotein [Candidatus Competibacteraceae bacterium]|nr:YnbE family lipoprotein [Candidatus Competibacteraceae bacterium]